MNLTKIIRITVVSLTLAILYVTAAAAQGSAPELFETSFEAEANGEYASALNNVLKIVRSDTKNYTALLRSGWLFYLNQQYESSVAYYQKANKLKPKAVEPLLGMSLPLISLQKWETAEAIVKSILKKDPGNYLANSRLAYIFYSEGKYSDAKSYYLQTLQLYPGDIDMKLGLGWTYVKMGHKNRAAIWFNDVLQVRKTNVSALAGMDAVRQM